MSNAFDDRFADRVREAFDAYEEPVDEAALERMRAALGHAAPAAPPPVPPRAADRPAVAGRGGRRLRFGSVVALSAVLATVAVGLWLAAPDAPLEVGPTAVASAPTPGGAGPGPPPTLQEGGAADGAVTAAPPAARPAPPSPSLAVATPRPGGAGSGPPSGAVGLPGGGAQAPSPSPSVRADGPDPAPAAVEPAAPPAPAAPAEVDLAALPPGPSVFAPPALAPVPEPPRPAPAGDRAGRGGVGLVVAASSAVAEGQGGAGVSAGLTREWAVGRRVSVSGGAAVAYTRLTVEREAAPLTFSPSTVGAEPVDVTTESALATLAVEIPVDVGVDLVAGRRGRLGVSVGLTSAVYLAQTFDDEGDRFAGVLRADPAGGDSLVVLTSAPFASRETVGALGRVDLARQLNLAVRLAPGARSPVSVDVYARLPLRGVTSRDLPLATAGVRVRYAF